MESSSSIAFDVRIFRCLKKFRLYSPVFAKYRRYFWMRGEEAKSFVDILKWQKDRQYANDVTWHTMEKEI